MSAEKGSAPQVILLTGVLGGIGSAIGELMHERGYLVVGLDRCPPKDGQVPTYIDTFIECDIRTLVDDSAEATELGQTILDAVAVLAGGAKLTALVNNAAYQVVAPVEETSMTMWSEVRCPPPPFLSPPLPSTTCHSANPVSPIYSCSFFLFFLSR